MEASNPMDESPRPRCSAKSKRSGQRCGRYPAVGRSVCAAHGGKTPVGPASPHWTDGRYSKILPARLLDRYHEASRDEELLALRSEVALIDARIHEVLTTKIDTGESSRVWKSLGEAYAKLRTAQLLGDEVGERYAIATLGTLITRGHDDWAAWDDVRSLIRDRQRLCESERKRMVENHHVISVDAAMGLMAQLVDAVREVGDDQTLRAITREFARLTGSPDPTAAADC